MTMLTFDELLAQVTDLVQQQGRVSYRALKRRFDIDDEYLEDLKAELLEFVDKHDERYYEAELYRLKGTLTLEARGWRLKTSPSSPQVSSLKSQISQAVAQEAEGYFLKAIEIAQRQQAKSLELRAVMSLSRLWQQQDKKKEAHDMLAEIYGWFTEGFDTKDLQEARALIESLSH